MRKAAALSALAALLALPAHAAGERVRDAWIRYIAPGAPAAGYFVVDNDSDRPLRLTGARSPAFAEAMLHRTRTASGMARMTHVDAVTVPARGTLEVAPGGYHLMLIGAKRTFAPGERVPITLEFAGGGRLDVEFVVRGPAGH